MRIIDCISNSFGKSIARADKRKDGSVTIWIDGDPISLCLDLDEAERLLADLPAAIADAKALAEKAA